MNHVRDSTVREQAGAPEAVVWDLCVIGGGAAGLMAAISAGRAAREAGRTLRIVILDSARRLGAKILVSGGGRCNVTHDVVHPSDYAVESAHRIRSVLKAFGVEQTIAFFADLGVVLKREQTGKLFPVTDQAATVLEALLTEAQRVGVTVLTSTRIERVSRDDGHFLIQTTDATLRARTLILATGGRSLPKTGSDGHGYSLAQALGHSVTETAPALVPLVLREGHWLTQLAGISFDAQLTLCAAGGRVMHRQAGSVLLTHFGLSGPAPMDISRHWIFAHRHDPAVRLELNLLHSVRLPGGSGPLDFEQLDAWLVQVAQDRPRQAVAELLAPLGLPRRLLDGLVHHEAGMAERVKASQWGREPRRVLVHRLLGLPLPVVRDRGYLFAEVTAGGVPLAEVDAASMASRCCGNLFLCGEILNVDGRIGGYNFQWAWCTGHLAGQHAAARALSLRETVG